MVKQVLDKTTGELLDVVRETVLPNGRIRVDHMNYEKSLTQQSFADMCDINKIMSRWLSGGPPPASPEAQAVFRDVSHGMDYRELLDVTMNVQMSFDELPAEVRSRFKNDPALLLDFVGDHANYDECVKLGLIEDDLSSNVGFVPTTMGQVTSEQLPLDVTVRTDTTVVS